MFRYKILFFTFFHLAGSLGGRPASVFAQAADKKSKADLYFENYEYSKAIPLYKKTAGLRDTDMKRLGDCYRLTKNFREAEACYGKLVSKGATDPKMYYYYGEALLFNNKYDEAKKQFSVYSTLDPDDSKGDWYAKACDELKIVLTRPAVYTVQNLGEINSGVSDFSPAFYKEGLVFTSERSEDLVNFNESKWTGNPYLTLIYAKGTKVAKKTGKEKDSVAYGNGSIFYKKFSGKGHAGPACFNADYSEMFFTRAQVSADSKKGQINQAKLYWSKFDKGWKPARPMPFNSEEYATGHPAISKDGQYLYFTSNMPGGQGGTDIWVSKREGDIWGAPQNLGLRVNTKGDESFPYISTEGILYFSSNGHPGYGGLDLFSAVQSSEIRDLSSGGKEGKWGNVINLPPPVNSTGDDFGILLLETNKGYFSSNRLGGKGGDDLYSFMLSGEISDMAGRVLLSNRTENSARQIKVFLLDEKGNIMQSTVTDANGSFVFTNLPADRAYSVKVDESDPNLVNQKKFYLTDSRSRIIRTVVKGKEGFFIFQTLPPDLGKLSEIPEEDPSVKKISIAGNLYSGDQHAPVENTRVDLMDDKGNVVETATTNSFGSFVFMNILPDKNYTIVVDESDPVLAGRKIYFTNKSGKEVAVKEKKPFEFKILATDKATMSLLTVEDNQLLVDMNGILFQDPMGKKRLANSNVVLVDEKGNVVATAKTDGTGNFKFINLPADKIYLVKLKEEDPALSTKEIFMADPAGKVIATLKSAKGKFFKFSVLPTDEQAIVKIYFDDPWLKVARMQSEARKDSMTTITENVYYDYQKWDLGSQALITLNKVVEVMKTNPNISIVIRSHTDSRGSDESNFKLSLKRSQAAIDYMIAKGIAPKRLSPAGKGETQLVNRCKNDVECTEEEHAQNRRTEFNIRSNTK